MAIVAVKCIQISLYLIGIASTHTNVLQLSLVFQLILNMTTYIVKSWLMSGLRF